MEFVEYPPREQLPRAYVESTVVSNLTSRPSNVWQDRLYQDATREWWMRAGGSYELVISPIVVNEVSKGDPEAVRARLEALQGLPVLPMRNEALALARDLLARLAVPVSQFTDATHIALASVHRVEYLLSWNFKHIVNPHTRPLIRKIVESAGYPCPEICTPLDLLGGEIHDN